MTPDAVTISRWRGVGATVPVAAGPVTVALTYALFRSELPERLPLRWDAETVTGTAPTWLVATVCALVGLVALAICAAVIGGAGRLGFHSQRTGLVACAGLSGLASGAWWTLITVALSQVGSLPPEQMRSPGAALSWLVVWLLLLSLATLLLCGGPTAPTTTLQADPALPRVQLPEHGRTRWQVHSYAGLFTVGACVLGLFGSTVYWTSPVLAVISWTVAGLSLLSARMTLRIDHRGVTLAPWGLPVPVTIPYDQIIEARDGEVDPVGWSRTGHRVINARSGAVPRQGSGVTLLLADGRTLGLALDEAEVAAGVVNAHLDRLRGGPRRSVSFTPPVREFDRAHP